MKGQLPAESPVEKKPARGDVSVKELWAEAAKAFEEICGESLQRGDVKGFDDVQKKIESAGKASYGIDAEEEGKWEKAKIVGLKSLKYLKMLVGAASQASSFVCVEFHSLPLWPLTLPDPHPFISSQYSQRRALLRV